MASHQQEVTVMSESGDQEGDDALLDQAWLINEADVGNYSSEDLPVNGHQYLHRVMKEASTLPVVVVAEINRKRFESKQNVYVAPTEVYEIPEKHLPTQDWQNQQVEDFDKTRETVSKMRCRLQSEPNFKIPDVQDPNDEWFNFIWKSDVKEPVLQLMLAFNQPSLDRLLHLFKRWLEEDKILLDPNICLWIYSLLACLEIPLMPTTFSTLRCLAQLAIKRRSQMVQTEETPNEKEIAQFNLLICIVGRYYKQIDLADKY